MMVAEGPGAVPGSVSTMRAHRGLMSCRLMRVKRQKLPPAHVRLPPPHFRENFLSKDAKPHSIPELLIVSVTMAGGNQGVMC